MLHSLVVLAVISSAANAQPVKREAERYRVVIVGAGASGFTAAATLLEHNVTDIILLEASDRIGGRIHTVEFGGVLLDKGAEYCHGEKDNEVYELAHPYDLLTSYDAYVNPENSLCVSPSGTVFNSTLVKNALEKAEAILNEEGVKHHNGSLAEYFYPRLEEMVKVEHLDEHLAESVHHLAPLIEGGWSASGNLDDIGATGFNMYVQSEGDQGLTWKSGGYKQIFDLLSKRFPHPEEELPVVNKTLFNKLVTRVEQKDGQVEVSCADGSTFHADHVIITVSIGVLKKHAAGIFHPALSERKSAAINTLGFGCVGKVFMLFPNKWLPENVTSILPLFSKKDLEDFRRTSEHGSWTSNTTGFYGVIQHDRMLCAWFTGESCRTMESLSDEQVTDGLMEILNKLVGSRFEIPRPESILKSGWASNPYTLGSYGYHTVESDRLNITNSDLEQLIVHETKPVILFAGEATHPTHEGTVHGAIGTGRREANRLLDHFKQQS